MNRPATRVWALNAVLIGAAALISIFLVAPLPSPPSPTHWVPWWALACLFFVSEIAVVHFRFRKEALSFSLNELPIVAGLFFTAPLGMVLAQAVGAAAALAIHRRQVPLKLVFNVAKLSLEAAVAQVIFHAIVGTHPYLGVYGWVAGLAAVVVVDSLGGIVVQTAITLSDGRPKTDEVLRAILLSVAGGITSASLAILGVTVIGHDRAGVWLLLIPAGMLFLAYRAYVGERERYESIELLYEANRIMQRAESLDMAVTELLVHVRTMFKAEIAEIALLTAGTGERAMRSRLGPGPDAEGLTETEAEPIQLALANLPPEARGTILFSPRSTSQIPDRLAQLGVRDAMVTQLEGERRVIGTLMVANRRGEQWTFRESDRRLFETLAAQAGFSLENGRLEQTLEGMRVEHAELEHQALHDPLTRLANRVLFTDRVTHALEKRPDPQTAVAVMFIDLDDFKTVNDSLGHAAGDELLIQVAERLTQSVRPEDTVARLGGDEFAVLMDQVSHASEATNVGKRILDSLNTPFTIAGQEVWAHATIGIASAVPGSMEPADLLRRADLAMYTAKGEGKGRYAVFGDRMRMGVLRPPARGA